MSDKMITEEMLVKQLEDALEERQTPDRRQSKAGLPDGIQAERRKGDRRQDKDEKN